MHEGTGTRAEKTQENMSVIIALKKAGERRIRGSKSRFRSV